MKLREAVGEALRRRRQAQGRTLREVAEAAGVSLTYLSEVERGRKEASSEVLEAVCAALRLGLAELFCEVAETLAAAEAVPVPAIGFLPHPAPSRPPPPPPPPPWPRSWISAPTRVAAPPDRQPGPHQGLPRAGSRNAGSGRHRPGGRTPGCAMSRPAACGCR